MLFQRAAFGPVRPRRDCPAVWARAARGAVAAGQADWHLALVPRSHPRREAVERCIRDIYAQQFGARGLTLASTLLALLDGEGRPLSAAGLRIAEEGFFSEAYLDEPIERVLSGRIGAGVARDTVFEVTTLASGCAEASPFFIRQIALLGRSAGFAWSFFTATGRLRKLLSQLGILTIELQPADPSRIAGPEQWGSYYAQSPVVCAVNEAWLTGSPAHRGEGVPDA